MTAVSDKVKKLPKIHKKTLPDINRAGVLVCLFLSAGGAKAQWADIPLPFISLVLAAACTDRLYKAVLAGGSAVTLIVMAVGDVYYLPYMLGLALYIVCFNNISEKWRLTVGTAVFALSKIILVCISKPLRYSVCTILECMAVCRLTEVLSCAVELPDVADNFSFGDVVTLFITAFTVTTALSAFDSLWLYTGAGCCLAAAWVYSRRANWFYCLCGLVWVFFALSDKNNFAILCGCTAAVWLAGALYSEKNSGLIYPAVAVTALGRNIAFLPRLGGFALTGTALTALLVYTFAPQLFDMPRMKKPEFFTRQKDYHQLMLSVKKLENSLNYLGSCAMDISVLNEKNLVAKPLEDIVAEEVCRNCSMSSYCWQEKYSYTAQQFARYAKSMSWAGEKGFDMGFYSQCTEIEKVKKSFEENSRLLLSRRYTMQSRKNNQKLLQNAFMSIAAAIGDLISHNRSSRLVNSTITMQTDRLLDSMGIPHSYCLCSQNPDKATFASADTVDESRLYKIKLRLEQLYEEKFSDCITEKQGNELLYTFYARPLYTCDHRVKSSAFRQVNGDGWKIFTLGGRLYALLSDGMGTGSAAAAESHTVLEMAASLLSAGTDILNTIDIVNLAMNLRGGSESGATLDILAVDLYTGKSVLAKAGANVSVVLSGGGMTRYYKDSLPLGMVKDTKAVLEEFTLKNGDTIIMMTDGVGDISANIRNLYDTGCEETARYILNENKTLDDKTVVVIKLKLR